MEKFEFTVVQEHQGKRMDHYLSLLLPSYSRSYIQKIIKENGALLYNQPLKANYKVQVGNVITFLVPTVVELDVLPQDIPLNILYEDEQLLVINKPKGMVVHPSAGHSTDTLVNALMFHCKGELSGMNGVLRPGIVHRIDMNTTGALVVCKTDQAHQFLAAQLKVHSITRKYRAIVCGNIKENEGCIEGAIGRHPIERKKMAIVKTGGKNAITHFHVLERFGAYTYIECQLETGRTHQIRVHMSSLGHPLLGDTTYGPKKCTVANLTGQTLHAMVLGFIHPTTLKYMEFIAPLPEYFVELLDKLKQ